MRAATVAKELINTDKVDLVLSTSTPETVNPVADACEAAGVPALSTTAPWEAFYFGRGAKPGEPSPFKWTYHFCFGVGNFATLYADQWSKVPTNKKVGMLLPADADGNAIRGLLIPALQKAGFTVVDAGPYQNGIADFSAQIQKFRSEGVEIFNTFPFPPDFAVFWRQAAQRGLARQLKIVQLAKAGLFSAEMEALGPLGARPARRRLLAPRVPVQERRPPGRTASSSPTATRRRATRPGRSSSAPPRRCSTPAWPRCAPAPTRRTRPRSPSRWPR